MTAEKLIAFERRVADLFESGELPSLIHLSGGNEAQLLTLFAGIAPGDWVFSTHRSHYHALLAGVPEEKLFALIAVGRSMFLYDAEHRFFTSSIVGGTPAIAAGVALAIKQRGGQQRVWCFVGDGCEDSGHFCEAVRFVQGRDLPCKFIIEDNDLSVESSKKQRWGIAAPFTWPPCVLRYTYTPKYPHGGTGCKQWVKFNESAIERMKGRPC